MSKYKQLCELWKICTWRRARCCSLFYS